MNERLKHILLEAVAKWGVNAQTDMAIEEMGELIVAVNHYRRGREGAIDNVQEEIADVIIAMNQMKMMYGSDAVDAIIEQKLNRLEKRLQL